MVRWHVRFKCKCGVYPHMSIASLVKVVASDTLKIASVFLIEESVCYKMV